MSSVCRKSRVSQLSIAATKISEKNNFKRVLSFNPAGPLGIYYGSQLSALVGFLGMQPSQPLLLVLSFGIFSFCLFVLSYSNVLTFKMDLSRLYYYPLKACLCPNERRKGGGSG